MKKISIIISVYNEEEALEEFYRVSCPVFEALSWDYERGRFPVYFKTVCRGEFQGQGDQFFQKFRS